MLVVCQTWRPLPFASVTASVGRRRAVLLLSCRWCPSKIGLDFSFLFFSFLQFRVQQSTELGRKQEGTADPSNVCFCGVYRIWFHLLLSFRLNIGSLIQKETKAIQSSDCVGTLCGGARFFFSFNRRQAFGELQ